MPHASKPINTTAAFSAGDIALCKQALAVFCIAHEKRLAHITNVLAGCDALFVCFNHAAPNKALRMETVRPKEYMLMWNEHIAPIFAHARPDAP